MALRRLMSHVLQVKSNYSKKCQPGVWTQFLNRTESTRSFAMATKYATVEKGTPNSPNYRVFLSKFTVSSIPLWAMISHRNRRHLSLVTVSFTQPIVLCVLCLIVNFYYAMLCMCAYVVRTRSSENSSMRQHELLSKYKYGHVTWLSAHTRSVACMRRTHFLDIDLSVNIFNFERYAAPHATACRVYSCIWRITVKRMKRNQRGQKCFATQSVLP